MGWYEDHRNTVTERWRKKYRESGLNADEFTQHMKKTMLENGWSEDDANKMVAQAVREDRKKAGE